MLGLGNSICANDYPGGWTPLNSSNLVVWLKFNTNITADQNSGASASVDHSSNAGNMEDGDRINAWNAFAPTTINAVQTNSGDKPRWETDSADLGSVAFPAGIKYMDFSADTTVDANTDFSVVARFKATGFNGALMGSTEQEFIKMHDENTIKFRINNTLLEFEESSATIEVDTYYTIIFSRTNGSTGDLNVYINGGAHSDKDWDAAETNQNNNNFVISNLGSHDDDGLPFRGFMKDVLIYNGTALTAGNRAELYTYLDAQE